MSAQPKVLISRRIPEPAVEFLSQRCQVDYNPKDEPLPRAELLARVADCDGMVCMVTEKIDEEFLGAASRLKVVSNVAVGYDNYDLAAMTRHKVMGTNTPKAVTDTTADFAFTLLMAAARQTVQADKYVREGRFKRWYLDFFLGQDIHHATLGILGFGRIGQAVARRARGFDMRIVYHDVVRAPITVENDLAAEYVSKETLLRESDFVSLHVPLMAETRHLIGATELAMMKKTAILVNTSRGPVVDEAALAAALKDGVIKAAGIDVYEREPNVHPDLPSLENIVLAPHIASASWDTRIKMAMMAAENCLAALAGRRPPNLVNTDVVA